MEVFEITSDSELQRVIRTGPCLIIFHVPWCAPCRAQGPIVRDMAGLYNGRAFIGAMNTEEHQDVAQRLRIEHLPTMMFFNGGHEITRLWGLQPEHALCGVLDRIIG